MILEKKLPDLEILFGAYFHQDWEIEYSNEEDVIRAFIHDSSPDEIKRAYDDLDWLIQQGLSESALQNIIVKDLGCSYWKPGYIEDFVRSVHEQLAAEIDEESFLRPHKSQAREESTAKSRSATFPVRLGPPDQQPSYAPGEDAINADQDKKGKETFRALIALVIVISIIFLIALLIQLAGPGTRNANGYRNCFLYNDDNSQIEVNVRANCDTRSCLRDSSTIVAAYPNNTLVVIPQSPRSVTAGRFTWIEVILVSNARTVWISSSKIRCQ
jgi:hypothetical protein